MTYILGSHGSLPLQSTIRPWQLYDKLMRADIMLCESSMGLRPARVSNLPYQEPVSFLFKDLWTPQDAP